MSSSPPIRRGRAHGTARRRGCRNGVPAHSRTETPRSRGYAYARARTDSTDFVGVTAYAHPRARRVGNSAWWRAAVRCHGMHGECVILAAAWDLVQAAPSFHALYTYGSSATSVTAALPVTSMICGALAYSRVHVVATVSVRVDRDNGCARLRASTACIHVAVLRISTGFRLICWWRNTPSYNGRRWLSYRWSWVQTTWLWRKRDPYSLI